MLTIHLVNDFPGVYEQNTIYLINNGDGKLKIGMKGTSTTATLQAAAPLDATLTALAALTTANNQLIYSTGPDAFAMAALTAYGRSFLANADADEAINTLTLGTVAKLAADADGALAANSDVKVATQKAVKTYVDSLIASNDAMVFKGVIDCGNTPDYPAADCGWTYRVSVSGSIGGESGASVEAGDILICLADGTATGTQASVGSSWGIIQVNIDGALTVNNIGSSVQAYSSILAAISALSLSADKLVYATGANSFSITPFAQYARDLLACADGSAFRTAIGLGTASTAALSTDSTMASDSDGEVPSVKAVKAGIATASAALASSTIARQADGASIALASGTDLDTISMTGFFRGPSLVNAPEGDAGWWYVATQVHDQDWQHQSAVAFSVTGIPNGTRYTRVKAGGIWQPWEWQGLNGTKALFNASCSNGDFVFHGEIRRIEVPDTRGVSPVPFEYPSAAVFDFKAAADVGSPPVQSSNLYCSILTVCGWSDSSGGYPTQLSFGDGLAVRQANSDTTWGPWVSLAQLGKAANFGALSAPSASLGQLDIGGNRPASYHPSFGALYLRNAVDASPWAQGLYLTSNDGSVNVGQFGTYGVTGGSASYSYVAAQGQDYSTATMKVTTSGVDIIGNINASAAHIANGNAYHADGPYGSFVSNAYYTGGWKYKANGGACWYSQTNGTHVWYSASTGVADADLTFSQNMTLDANGVLTISGLFSNGTVNSYAAEGLRVINSSGFVGFYNSANTLYSGYLQISATGQTTLATMIDQDLVLRRYSVEKLRATGTGISVNGALTVTDHLLVGVTSGANHIVKKEIGGAFAGILSVVSDNGSVVSVAGGTDVEAASAATQAALYAGRDSGTNRSVNITGTLNASGADYAEYERNGGLSVHKGDVVGFKSDGTLTLTFGEAIRFGVKSTNPSYVGGDTWGGGDAVGQRPVEPLYRPPAYIGPEKPDALVEFIPGIFHIHEPMLREVSIPEILDAPVEPIRAEGEEDTAWALRVNAYVHMVNQYQLSIAQHGQALHAADLAQSKYARERDEYQAAQNTFDASEQQRKDIHIAQVAEYEIRLAEHQESMSLYQEEVAIAEATHADALEQYRVDLAEFESRLETARQSVDRIAYSGKVPVNVQGAIPGWYIIAAEALDGGIIGEFVADPTFGQYKLAVGRVNRLLEDGRCEIAVMVH